MRFFFLYIYAMKYSFKKQERLKSKKIIEQLFSEGKSISRFPIKLFFLPIIDTTNTQVGFAVPKKKFSSAVTRNRIKRQLREGYRLQKNILETESGKKFALMFLYIGKEKPSYEKLYASITSLLKTIIKSHS